MAKLDQKFKKRSAHRFDEDDETYSFSWERKKQKKMRRDSRQRNPEY